MLFSSLVFLVLFLPFTLLGYYLMLPKHRNGFLFLASLFFFAWGGVSYSAILIGSIIFNYFFGILIDRKSNKKLYLSIGVSFNLLVLVVFKYANFIIENINQIVSVFEIPSLNNPSILLPIGISFYTFQSLSYLVDVYRKTCKVQTNIVNLGLYISLFPQLIAGPIVRYFDIQKQIEDRTHTIEKFQSGVLRFVLGFGKKILIANNMAFVADKVFALSSGELNSVYAWIGIIAYALQIYYDFAGYSDMAIGLARMFGFELLENFNFPYIAKSIKEFWRRWHISLSNWFRDYLYIPLGGNRGTASRTILNLFIVFFVTGFWHGASWNFLLWGILHGAFLVLERTKVGLVLDRLPTLVKHFYTLFVVLMAWVLFRVDSLSGAIDYYHAMFGGSNSPINNYFLSLLINRGSVFVFIIAILGAFGFFPFAINYIEKNIPFLIKFKTISIVALVVFILVLGVGNLVLGSYNPFIYFRF